MVKLQNSLDWTDIGIQQNSHCCPFKRFLLIQPRFLTVSEKGLDVLLVCVVQCD